MCDIVHFSDIDSHGYTVYPSISVVYKLWHSSCLLVDTMNTRSLHIKKSHNKTILIVIGVLIAVIMTMSSSYLTAKSGISVEQNDQETVKPFSKTSASDVPTLNSGTRLLHIFTKNLPYLNHK